MRILLFFTLIVSSISTTNLVERGVKEEVKPLILQGFPIPFHEWLIENPWFEQGSKIFVYIGRNKINSIPASIDGSKFFDLFHISLVFYKSDEWISLELFMSDPLDIPGMFAPHQNGDDGGEQWTNRASIKLEWLGRLDRRPNEFEELISIGETNGSQFGKVLKFIFEKIQKNNFSIIYDVFTIVDEDTNKIIRPARSCFEFIQDILSVMHIKLSEPIVTYPRDTVFVRAKNVVVHQQPYSEEIVNTYKDFLTNLIPDLPLISRHLVYLRIVFAKKFHAKKSWFFGGIENDQIWEIQLSSDFTDNGCRELITLIPAYREDEVGPLKIVRGGWNNSDETNCALPFQKMHELTKFLSQTYYHWTTLAVYFSLGIILITAVVVHRLRIKVYK